jgi:hypothetical protein
MTESTSVDTSAKPTYREVMTPTVTRIDESHTRVVFSVGDREVACLYYENAKRSWSNKPISMNQWRCVDAQVNDKTIYINGIVEPKDLVGWGQELLLSPKDGIHNGEDNISNKNSL